MRKTYRTYDYVVKKAVITAKNPRLFPELKIPLSTARHWIRKGITPPVVQLSTAESHSSDSDLVEICYLVIKLLGDDVDLSKLTSLELGFFRRVFAFQEELLAKIAGRKLFNKLRRAVSPCAKSIDGLCVKRFSSQLTGAEIKIMKRLVTSRQYSHMSISSLSLWAIRERVLLCSSHTWYKYIARHKWQRLNVKQKKTRRSSGLKATRPNEIWHVDVSEIETLDERKHFLQVVYDNYSRYVIAWSLSHRICASNTERLLKRARRNTVIAMDSSLLVVDGGTENTAKRVTAAIEKFKPTLIRKIARKEIRNSNTMIEIFFKMLKTNHLNNANPRDRQALARRIIFYVRQHNEVVPMRALDGDTPSEVLYSNGRKNSSEMNAQILSKRRAFRVIENRQGLCQICL